MASRPKEPQSPLTLAAVALETELERYEETVSGLEAASITSEKTLQRARVRLEKCAELEQRLGAALTELAQAMQITQARQQRCMEATLGAAARIEQRWATRNALLERMKALGERAKAVAEPALVATSGSPNDSTPSTLLSSLQAVSDLTESIIEEASLLQRAAKEEEWLDIERDTDTLKQQLLAARNKILSAHRKVASRAPS